MWKWILCSVIVLAVAVAPAHAAMPTLARLLVQPTDLPRGFVRSEHQTYTPVQYAQSQNEDPATYSKRGLTGAADVGYTFDPRGAIPHGLAAIIERYNSPAHATRAYNMFIQSLSPKLPSSFHRLPAANIGERRYAASFITNENGITEQESSVVWQRGAYFVSVIIFGYTASFPAVQAVRLATIMDTRIQHAR